MPEVQAHSALLWGRNLATERARVRVACERYGIHASRLFRDPSKGWALREACRWVAGEMARHLPKEKQPRSIEIRPCDGSLSYEAVGVQRRIIQNAETFLFSVQHIGGTTVVLRHARWLDAGSVAESVDSAFATRMQYLNPTQVRNLVDRIVHHLGGVELGGVNTFYIPPMAVERMREFRERAGLVGYGLTSFGISTDPDTVTAVTGALAREVRDELESIRERADAGTGGRRLALALSEQAAALARKVTAYEAVIGQSLPDLTRAIEEANHSAALASLMAAAI